GREAPAAGQAPHGAYRTVGGEQRSLRRALPVANGFGRRERACANPQPLRQPAGLRTEVGGGRAQRGERAAHSGATNLPGAVSRLQVSARIAGGGCGRREILSAGVRAGAGGERAEGTAA